MTLRPFVFGMQFLTLPAHWKRAVRHYEPLGITRFTFHDHFFATQEGPMAGLGAIAAVAERAGVETNVLDLTYWNPAVLAREAATLARIAPGGFDVGIGAGWNPSDAGVAGVSFPPAGERLGRLRDVATILRQFWTDPEATYEGRYYSKATSVGFGTTETTMPRLLIGATRPQMLALAGELNDVISVYATLSEELDWAGWATDSSATSYARKVELALDAARAHDRDVDALDLHTVTSFVTVADDPAPLQAEVTATTGVDVEVMRDSFMFLTGSFAEARDTLLARREVTGINYYIFQPFQVGDDRSFSAFAEHVLAPLSGT